MRSIPSTLVLCVLSVILASWPAVQTWAMGSLTHHFLSHGLYLLAGGLFGLQTARWVQSARMAQPVDEGGVSS
ncbi:MAG: hypothetical protein K6T26_04210 [Alicyclobacillus sp.]|nr:hypothetical protein [Alicyclobacillus sp.]